MLRIVSGVPGQEISELQHFAADGHFQGYSARGAESPVTHEASQESPVSLF